MERYFGSLIRYCTASGSSLIWFHWELISLLNEKHKKLQLKSFEAFDMWPTIAKLHTDIQNMPTQQSSRGLNLQVDSMMMTAHAPSLSMPLYIQFVFAKFNSKCSPQLYLCMQSHSSISFIQNPVENNNFYIMQAFFQTFVKDNNLRITKKSLYSSNWVYNNKYNISTELNM